MDGNTLGYIVILALLLGVGVVSLVCPHERIKGK